MLKIFYTNKENLDERQQPIDESLILSVEDTIEFEDTLSEEFIVVSRWDLEDYNNMMLLQIERNKESLLEIVTNYIDETAKSMHYDSIESIAKYIGFENPFQEECLKLAKFNALCWIKYIELETSISSEQVIKEDIISLLPQIN